MKRKPKPKIPNNLGYVVRFLERHGLRVYGPNYHPPHSVYPAYRDFDARLIRRYVAEMQAGTLLEEDTQ